MECDVSSKDSVMKNNLFVKAIGIAALVTVTQFSVIQSSSAAESISTSTNADKPIKTSREFVSLSASTWQSIDRSTARYPSEASTRKISGCATVKYTLSPENQISNINVVAASHKSFAREAHKAVKSWNFESIKTSITDKEIETQTRFQFCTNKRKDCASVTQNVCNGDDVIAVIASDKRTSGLTSKGTSLNSTYRLVD